MSSNSRFRSSREPAGIKTMCTDSVFDDFGLDVGIFMGVDTCDAVDTIEDVDTCAAFEDFDIVGIAVNPECFVSSDLKAGGFWGCVL